MTLIFSKLFFDITQKHSQQINNSTYFWKLGTWVRSFKSITKILSMMIEYLLSAINIARSVHFIMNLKSSNTIYLINVKPNVCRHNKYWLERVSMNKWFKCKWNDWTCKMNEWGSFWAMDLSFKIIVCSSLRFHLHINCVLIIFVIFSKRRLLIGLKQVIVDGVALDSANHISHWLCKRGQAWWLRSWLLYCFIAP